MPSYHHLRTLAVVKHLGTLLLKDPSIVTYMGVISHALRVNISTQKKNGRLRHGRAITSRISYQVIQRNGRGK